MTIRFRLAAMFSIATAVALVVGGAVLVRSLEAGIRTSLDTSLLARADSLVQAVRDSPNGIDFYDSPGSKLLPARDAIRQILDPAGRVVEASQYAGTKPIVVSNAESQSGSGIRFSYATIEGDRHRILSTGVDRSDGHWTVIVAGSLEATEEAITQVRESLIRGGVVAVLFAAVGSWLLARSALRPVERMRRFAKEISAHDTDAELPVPRPQLQRLRRRRTLFSRRWIGLQFLSLQYPSGMN